MTYYKIDTTFPTLFIYVYVCFKYMLIYLLNNNLIYMTFFRYLASGETYRSLSFAFRISHSYISIIIKNTLKSMKMHLLPICIPNPSKLNMKDKDNEFWT